MYNMVELQQVEIGDELIVSRSSFWWN